MLNEAKITEINRAPNDIDFHEFARESKAKLKSIIPW